MVSLDDEDSEVSSVVYAKAMAKVMALINLIILKIYKSNNKV